MTTKSLIAIAAALAAGFALNAPSAEAGGGVRLGFGGPLISFVARETLNHAMQPRHHQYGRSAYRAPRSYEERPTYKKHVSRKNDDDDKSSKAKKKSDTKSTVAKSDNDDTSSVKQLATNAIPLETSASPAPTAAQSTSAPQVLKLDSTAVGETTQPKAETAATEAAKPEAKAAPKVEAKKPEATKPEPKKAEPKKPEPKVESKKPEPKPHLGGRQAHAAGFEHGLNHALGNLLDARKIAHR